MTTPLTSFLPLVVPFVPGAPEPAILAALRQASIEFCENTRVWKWIFDPVTVVAGTATYAVPTQASSNTVIVEELYVDDRLLTPKSIDWLRERYPNWLVETGEPLFYTQLDQDNVTLVPSPVVAGTITGRVALKPSQAATVVPDILYNQYNMAIATGAAGFLMLTPDKPYSNLQLGAAKAASFEADQAAAKIDASRGFVRAAKRVRLQQF